MLRGINTRAHAHILLFKRQQWSWLLGGKHGIVEQSDVKKTEEEEATRFLFMVIHCPALKLISF